MSDRRYGPHPSPPPFAKYANTPLQGAGGRGCVAINKAPAVSLGGDWKEAAGATWVGGA
jgi:hypothetical protein